MLAFLRQDKVDIFHGPLLVRAVSEEMALDIIRRFVGTDNESLFCQNAPHLVQREAMAHGLAQPSGDFRQAVHP